MSKATRPLRLFWLFVFLAMGAIDLAAGSAATQAQASHPGPVTGVIDGVQFEGDQYYVHG